MANVKLIPCFKDNYAYLMSRENEAIIIDACEARPILEFLKKNNLNLRAILSTHHHQDHIAGNLELQEKTGCAIYGFEGDRHRIDLTEPLKENQQFEILGFHFRVMHVPGHTLGAIAYVLGLDEAVFSGDTLFSLGCGRLFEGTYEQMALSLQRFAQLSADCEVYCGHEYTRDNLKFLKSIDLSLPQVSESGPTLPSTIAYEMKWNPFLKAASQLEQFKNLRILKDQFHG